MEEKSIYKNHKQALVNLQRKIVEMEYLLATYEEDRLQLLQQKYTSNRELVQLRKQYRRHQQQRKKSEKQVIKILSSRSWKLSAPLRWFGGLLKGKSPAKVSTSRKEISASPTTKRSIARELNRKLWAGYSTYALKDLQKIKNDPNAPVNERLRALRSLAQWYFDREEFIKAYEEIAFVKEIRPSLHTHLSQIVFEIKILQKLGKSHAGLRKIWQAIESYGLQSDLCLGMAHLYENEEDRLHGYNLIYERHGLHKIRKLHEDEPLSLNNIHTPYSKRYKRWDSSKVSIIIPAYNAEHLIHIPLQSLLSQTIQNIEIIVVDDCSTDQTVKVVESFIQEDARIQLIQKEKNEGAYAARNTGLQRVTGDFVTVHDSDDWSHAQKLELQLKALFRNPEAVGSISFLARVLDSGMPINAGSLLGAKFLMMNSSSLLIHRSVLDQLGGWDHVKVAGDSEFIWRIERVYGPKSIVRVKEDVPLSLALSAETSLTGVHMTHIQTIMFGLRRMYREGFEWWHRQTNRLQDLYINPTETARPFPSPVPNQIVQHSLRTYDFVFVADFTTDEAAHLFSKWLKKGNGRERKCAIFHWYAYETDPYQKICDAVFHMLHEENIDILVPDEEVRARKILCLTPNVLDYLLEKTPIITCEQAILLENQGHMSEKEKKQKNFKKAFQVHPHWGRWNSLG